jgi:hypothetical protein
MFRKRSLLLFSSREDLYGRSCVLVLARALPHPLFRAASATCLSPSSSFQLTSREQTHDGPPSPQAPLDCLLCRLCSSKKNSFGASLHEEVSGPDCLMTKGQSELGLERARRIIHHILWQYRHRLMVELSPALGASRVHPRMLREDLVDVCESFPSTKPLFSEHVPPQIAVPTSLAACWDLAGMNGMTSLGEGRESLW